MGCGSSKNTSTTTEQTEGYGTTEIDETCIDKDFKIERKGLIRKFDKKTAKVKIADFAQCLKHNKSDEIRTGIRKMERKAESVEETKTLWVKPGVHRKPQKSAICENYDLEYVYGYRCEDARQNCYYNKTGEVIYMAAAVGIILDKQTNTQKFFGGGHTYNPKTNIHTRHSADIIALAISADKKLVATGQIGDEIAYIYIWDSKDGSLKMEFDLPQTARGVSALGFSSNGQYLGAADLHKNNNVYVFGLTGLQKDKLVLKEATGPGRIFGLTWSQKKDDRMFATYGVNHVQFWYLQNLAENGVGHIGEKGKLTTFICGAFDKNRKCYMGGMNGMLYEWSGRSLHSVTQVGNGPIHAISYIDNHLLVGSYDQNVRIYDAHLKELSSFHCNAIPRSIDKHANTYLVGASDGSICEYSKTGELTNTLMKGHFLGEAWGLDILENYIISCGDENLIFVFDYQTRKLVNSVIINEEENKVIHKDSEAHKLTTMAPNQCARSIAINRVHAHIAIGLNNGNVQIRESITSIDKIIYTLKEPKDWIETMKYSPNGAYLAVGSHDTDIYIYRVNEDYKNTCTYTRHYLYITSIDWSKDGKYIRGNCGGGEMHLYDAETGELDSIGTAVKQGIQWATHQTKFDWHVQGIHRSEDEHHNVNKVMLSHHEHIIATGEEHGIINLYNNPCLHGHQATSLRAHSQNVVGLKFRGDDTYIFSIGSRDKTVMQWKQRDPLLLDPASSIIDNQIEYFYIVYKTGNKITFLDKWMKEVNSIVIADNKAKSSNLLELNTKYMIEYGEDCEFITIMNMRTMSYECHSTYRCTKVVCILPNNHFAAYNTQQLFIVDQHGKLLEVLDSEALPTTIRSMVWVEETGEVWAGDNEGDINVWTIKTGALRKFPCFVNNQKVHTLMVYEDTIFSFSDHPPTIKAWNSAAKQLYNLSLKGSALTNINYYSQEQFIMKDDEGSVSLWDVPTKTQIPMFKCKGELRLMNSTVRVEQNLFIMVGEKGFQYVFANNGTVFLEFDVLHGQKITAITKALMKFKVLDHLAWELPGSVMVDNTTQRFVLVAKLETHQLFFLDKDLNFLSSLQLPEYEDNLETTMYQLNSQTLLDCGGESIIFINFRSMTFRESEENYVNCRVVAILPNSTFAIYNPSSRDVSLLGEDGKVVKRINENPLETEISCLLWVITSQELWGSTDSGIIYIWNLRTGKEGKIELKAHKSKDPDEHKKLAVLLEKHGQVISLGEYPAKLRIFSPNGNLLHTVEMGKFLYTNMSSSLDHQVVTGDDEGNSSVWDIHTRYQISGFRPPGANLDIKNCLIRVNHTNFLYPSKTSLKIIDPVKFPRTRVLAGTEYDVKHQIRSVLKIFVT